MSEIERLLPVVVVGVVVFAGSGNDCECDIIGAGDGRVPFAGEAPPVDCVELGSRAGAEVPLPAPPTGVGTTVIVVVTVLRNVLVGSTAAGGGAVLFATPSPTGAALVFVTSLNQFEFTPFGPPSMLVAVTSAGGGVPASGVDAAS